METKKVLYTEAIEGFFTRAVGSRLSPKAKRDLKAAGLDLDAKLKPMYPLEDFRRYVEIARLDLYPSLSRDDGYHRIGLETVRGYGETFIGKAMLSMARLIGPNRLLDRMNANVKGVNNFTRTEILRHAPNHVEYWFNELSCDPHYTKGLIIAALEACGCRDIRVEYLVDKKPYTFLLQWGV